MKCPKCGQKTDKYNKSIYKHGQISILRKSCPHCQSVVSEEKTNTNMPTRIVFIVLATPFVFAFLLLFSIWVGKSIEKPNYLVFSSVTLASILFLIIISHIRTCLKNDTQQKKPQ